MDLKQKALRYHAKNKGKIATALLTPIKNKEDLALAYTPGVASVCQAIKQNPSTVRDFTLKGRTVAIVTDGSAVLGLGNIGPEASLPVMEGKAALLKAFAGLDAFPICLDTQDEFEIIQTVKNIYPVFGGIILEDISAPRCFIIERSLQHLGIPVMHDDQHGTAVVALAGLINASIVADKPLKDLVVVISGAGAAGTAVAKLILDQVKEVRLSDSRGLIYDGRRENMDQYKYELALKTNPLKLKGALQEGLKGADVFIGVSAPNLVQSEDILLMNARPIIFAMANPTPEIMPDQAKKGGAFIVATGRSDFPNQINNSLAFPGIFKGALQAQVARITKPMKLAAAQALAGLVKNPTVDEIIPGPFDKGVVEAVSGAIA